MYAVLGLIFVIASAGRVGSWRLKGPEILKNGVCPEGLTLSAMRPCCQRTYLESQKLIKAYPDCQDDGYFKAKQCNLDSYLEKKTKRLIRRCYCYSKNGKRQGMIQFGKNCQGEARESPSDSHAFQSDLDSMRAEMYAKYVEFNTRILELQEHVKDLAGSTVSLARSEDKKLRL